MDNPERTEQGPPVLDPLVAELREQVRFLREELIRARAEAEEARQHAAELLAAKDAQIERLLALLAGRSPAEPVTAAVKAVEGGEETLEIPTETGLARKVESQKAVLTQGFKTRTDLCPYLGANDDRALVRTYPTKQNVCWSRQIKKVRRQQHGIVDNKHQEAYCLQDRHTQCAYFEPVAEASATAAIGEEPRKGWRLWRR
jgi:hypothetical protein